MVCCQPAVEGRLGTSPRRRAVPPGPADPAGSGTNTNVDSCHSENPMSRAYRIKIQEKLRRVLKASDHVRTELELLEILPPEQMAQLLTEQLQARGFEKPGEALVRTEKGVSISVHPATGEVTVRAESLERIDLEASTNVVADADWGKGLTKEARRAAGQELRKGLEQEAAKKTAALQQQVTERLEGR